MPKPRATGTNKPIRQPSELQFDPAQGFKQVERWVGVGPNVLNSLANEYQSLLAAYTLLRSGATSTLTATVPVSGGTGSGSDSDADTIDTWQVQANELQKDGREHPKSLAIAAATMLAINTAIHNSTDPGALAGDALKLYNLLLRGSTHYALGQYVLRHTTNVSNRYSKNVADSNVNCIYTTAQLLSECTNKSYWVFPMPGRIQAKINSIPTPTAQSDYLWGWRKLPSAEATAANNRIEIVTEYWLEQWSTFYYDPAT